MLCKRPNNLEPFFFFGRSCGTSAPAFACLVYNHSPILYVQTGSYAHQNHLRNVLPHAGDQMLTTLCCAMGQLRLKVRHERGNSGLEFWNHHFSLRACSCVISRNMLVPCLI